MTETTLDEVSHTQEMPKFLIRAVTVFMMLTGLFLSGSLLKWAVVDKFAKSEVIESSDITAAVRDRQLGCLAKNIYFEAGGEPFEGKVAVAQVTLNRVESGQFPNDICRTIYQKNIIYEKVICQFSWVCDRDSGIRVINKSSYDESMIVAKKVLLEGFRLPSLKDAMYFHADYINPGWQREKVAKIGRHIFYK